MARFRRIWLGAPILILILAILFFLHGQQPPPQPQDYAFSSKKVVTAGLPNSVIFDYDASRSPDDSVVIQQSWDTTRRVKVPKNGHQYTSIYYYPDYYHATLQVHDQVVKTHNLLIQSNGWLPLIEQDPVPVYFKKEEAIHDGKISLSLDQIREKNIPMQPSAPTVMFSNVRDFGEIYSDHFTFETAVRNDYSEGSAACQMTRIYLLCEGTAIWVPLCAKGCVSNMDLYFTYFYTSGKREDLSNFGVDLTKFVKLRIEVRQRPRKDFHQQPARLYRPPSHPAFQNYRHRLPLPGHRLRRLCLSLQRKDHLPRRLQSTRRPADLLRTSAFHRLFTPFHQHLLLAAACRRFAPPG